MAVERKYLDYVGLQQFWAAIKQYYDEKGIDVAQNLASGVTVTFKDAADGSTVLGTLTWDGTTKAQNVTLKMPAINASDPLAYDAQTGVLSIDLSNYYNKVEVDQKIGDAAARALNFKGVVETLPDPADPDNHAGDVYIVKGAAGASNKEYIFVAAEGDPEDPEEFVAAHWEELGFDIDLSGYYTRRDADETFVAISTYNTKVAALDAKDAELEAAVAENAGDITALEGRIDAVETDLTDTKNKVAANEGAIATLTEDLTTEVFARQDADAAEVVARDEAIGEAFNTQIHVIPHSNIMGMFEEQDIDADDPNVAQSLANAVESARTGGTVNLNTSAALAEPITLEDGQNVVLNLGENTAITGNGASAAVVLDDPEAELLITGDGEIATTTGIQVSQGTVTIDGGEFSGSSRGIQIGTLVKSDEQLDDIPAKVVINGGNFGGVAEGEDYASSQAGIILFGGDTVINDGTFINTWYGLSGNGTKNLPSANLTINGGYFEATGTADDNHGAAIYWPNEGTLTINGGTFKGGVAVYAKSGTVIINGGTFESDYAATEADVAANKATTVGGMRDYQYYGNGFYCTGDAIIIDSCCKYPAGDPKVKINKNIVMTTLAQGAHGIGRYYGRGVTPAESTGSFEVAEGLNIDSHVYDLN